MTDTSIAKIVTKLRTDKEWSMMDLSKRVGVTYATIRNLEQGKTLPTLVVAKTLCKVFKITLDELTKKLSIKKVSK